MGNANTHTKLLDDDSEIAVINNFDDFNPDQNGEVVQILKQDKDKKLVLDQNALVGILRHPSIGNRPVSIVTIAGPFRTGKSFMMNFFLRYLRNKGYINADWMGSEDTPLNDGFNWRGGVEKVTTGISVWSQPIIVRREGGQEIAVLLCDSQGTFDNQADKGDDMKVFTISLMMSSVLIYNLMSKIQTDNMEYLKLFINYTKRYTERAGKPSQKLFFLVRDWLAPLSFKYGDAEAKKYLASVLKGNQLDKTFKAISCYLMPTPGRPAQVFDGRQFEGNLKDLDIEFREHLSPLAACLLDPKNLVTKVQSGEMLINIIVKSWENIKKFETPNGIDEIYQVNRCLEKIFETMKSYHKDEGRILGDKSVNAKMAKKQLSNAKKQALIQFEKNCEDCSENIVIRAKAILREQLNGARTEYLLKDELIELHKKRKTQSIFQLMRKEYLFRMENKKALLGRDDKFVHDDVKKEIKEKFLPTPDNEDFESIQADLEFLFKQMDYDCSFKQIQHTIEVNNSVVEAAKHYEEIFEEKVGDCHDKNELQIFHKQSIAESDKILYAKVPEATIKQSQTQRDKLIQKIKEYIIHSSSMNQKKTDDTELYKIWQSFNKFMKMATREKVVENSYIIDKAHEFNELVKTMSEAFEFSRYEEFMTKKWNCKVDEICNVAIMRNMYLKEVAEAELSTFGHTILETLRAKLQEYDKDYFYNLEEILLKEQFFIQSLYDQKLNELFLDSWNKESRNEYFSRIEKEINLARKINSGNQNLMELLFKEETIRAQLAYCRAMEEKMTGAYIKPDILEEYHSELVSEACKNWEEEAKKTDVETRLRLKIQIKRMKSTLDELYKKFENWNEANKTLLRKVVGGISGLVGAAGVGGGAVAGTVLAVEVSSITATVAIASATGIGLGILAGVSVAGIAYVIGKKYFKNKDKNFFAEECHGFQENLKNVQSSRQ